MSPGRPSGQNVPQPGLGGYPGLQVPAPGGYGMRDKRRDVPDTRSDGLNPEYNEVIFEVREARNLQAGDVETLVTAASSDPFGIVRKVKGLVGQDQKTPVVRKSFDPVWNSSFRYCFDYKLSRFKIVVRDWDDLKPADSLGKFIVGLPAFYQIPADADGWQVLEGWFPLGVGSTRKWDWLRNKPHIGEIHVRIAVRFRVPLALPGRVIPISLSAPQFQVALGWDFGKGCRPIDLDVSVLGLNASWNIVDSVSFKKLIGFNGAVRHSGDDTTGEGGGDDETITFDTNRLSADVRFLCVVVNSYTGQSLAAVKHAYIRVIVQGTTHAFMTLYRNPVDRDAWRAGHRAEANPFAMKECTGLFFGMLCRDYGGHSGWSIATVNEVANGRTVDESLSVVIHFAQAFQNQPLPPPDLSAPVSIHPAVAAGIQVPPSQMQFPSSVSSAAPGPGVQVPPSQTQFPASNSSAAPTVFGPCEKVEYYSESQKTWVPAVILAFSRTRNLYDLNIRLGVDPKKIRRPPGPITTVNLPGEFFLPGTPVEYFTSTNNWIPATVLGFLPEPNVYDLDCKRGADPQRIRRPQKPAVAAPSTLPPGADPTTLPPGSNDIYGGVVSTESKAPFLPAGASGIPPPGSSAGESFIPAPTSAKATESICPGDSLIAPPAPLVDSLGCTIPSNPEPPQAVVGEGQTIPSGPKASPPQAVATEGQTIPTGPSASPAGMNAAENPRLSSAPTKTWQVEEVIAYLESLDLGHVASKFRANGVDGQMLLELSDDELMQELGLTKLQAKKIRQRLPS